MSGGCGRNPPPFPDNEDQEAELDTRALDSDEEEDDEDEDIFTGGEWDTCFRMNDQFLLSD